MKKQIRALALAVLFALSLLPAAGFAAENVATVNGTGYTSLQEALNAAAAGSGNVIVEILADIDLTGKDWNPVTVNATFKLAQEFVFSSPSPVARIG